MVMFSSAPTGKAPVLLRLSRRFRVALFTALLTLFLTGAGWLWADALKDTARGEMWQAVAANLLMLHGGAAMAALMLLGALAPLHVQRTWKSNRNRVTGVLMATFNAILILTAFGLYYAGSDVFRKWTSTIHIVVGLLLPALLVIHIWIGRRAARRSSSG